jgi:PD-(D/E)XK nuclease superfamily
MNKINRVENYLNDFFNHNIFEFDLFCETTNEQRREGIYKLENGAQILDFLNDVHGNITERLRHNPLVPHRFTTPNELLFYLKCFRDVIVSKSYLLKEDEIKENTSYIITHFIEYKNKIVKAIDYAFEIYDMEDDNILLYQQLRYHLIKQNVPEFIEDLKSIFSSVSYAIVRATEGYYHANVYLILKLLGFEIIPEDTTNIGRIDSVIRFSNKIYIVEFKFSNSIDESQIAFNQIVQKDYASKYRLEQKEIFGLGISFNENIRSIRNYKCEKL